MIKKYKKKKPKFNSLKKLIENLINAKNFIFEEFQKKTISTKS